MNTIGWLDFGAAEHRQAIAILEQMHERDTVDELGLGTIRDAFAERLFPGTSTIQTRARYFLIIPWVYQALEASKTGSAEISRRVKQHEIRVIKSLAHLGLRQGVIGIDAQEDLKRFPSSIYWYGLRSWGIRLFAGSQRQYHASLDTHYDLLGRTHATREDDPSHQRVRPNWNSAIPHCSGKPTEVDSLALTSAEAAFLREQIQIAHPDSLLAVFCDSDIDPKEVDTPWGHPDALHGSEALREDLAHAKLFSLVGWSATLLYQITLARLEERRQGRQQEEEYDKGIRLTKMLEEAEADLLAHKSELQAWKRQRFWERLTVGMRARIDDGTHQFVESWIKHVLGTLAGSPIGSAEAVRLISNRERRLKSTRARVDNAEARAAWMGQTIPAPMDYRWRATVQTLLTDIREGLAS